MERADDERRPEPDAASPPADREAHDDVPTVEAAVRSALSQRVGGMRGGVELALPIALFSLVYVVADEIRIAAIAGVAAGVVLYVIRLAQRSSTEFVTHGLVGIVIAAVIANATGRAEDAFLPGIIQSAAWALGLGLSIAVRWPAVGFVIGGVLGDVTGWRRDAAIVRLANRLTAVMLVPMVLRVSVQYPLYAAGEVGWLGASRVVLGWPLTVAAFAVAAAILARGHTPLESTDQPPR